MYVVKCCEHTLYVHVHVFLTAVQTGTEFTEQAQNTEQHWSHLLQHEQCLRLRVEENMETMAKQLHRLECEALRGSRVEHTDDGNSGESSDEFYDAIGFSQVINYVVWCFLIPVDD